MDQKESKLQQGQNVCIKITLLNTLLDQTYCVYKELDQFCFQKQYTINQGEENKINTKIVTKQIQVNIKARSNQNKDRNQITSKYWNDKPIKHTELRSELMQAHKQRKKVAKHPYKSTFLALNIKDGKDYLIVFYQIGVIGNQQLRKTIRQKILRKSAMRASIDSPYIVHCYGVYQNCDLGHIAVVYEYIKGLSLKQELQRGMIATDCFRYIIKNVYEGMNAVHRHAGLMVKAVDLSQVYFKNGCYKIYDFQVFADGDEDAGYDIYKKLKISDCSIYKQYAPQLQKYISQELIIRQANISSKEMQRGQYRSKIKFKQVDLKQNPRQSQYRPISIKSQVWALALFYLKLLLQKGLYLHSNPNKCINRPPISISQVLDANKLSKKQYLYTMELESYTQYVSQESNGVDYGLQMNNDIIKFFKSSLMVDEADRIDWAVLNKFWMFRDRGAKRSVKPDNRKNIEVMSRNVKNPQKKTIADIRASKSYSQLTISRKFIITQQYNSKLKDKNFNQKYDQDYIKNQIQQPLKPFIQLQNYDQSSFYKDFVKKFDYHLLTEDDIQLYLKVKSTYQQQIYQKLSQFYFQTQKCQYILTRVLIPIHTHRLIPLSQQLNRQNIQFMYLVSMRIFTDLSYINNNLDFLKNNELLSLKKKHQYAIYSQNLETEYERTIVPMIQEYEKLVQPVYREARTVFEEYASMLTKSESSWIGIAKGKFQGFWGNNKSNTSKNKSQDKLLKQEKQKFLEGIEGIDYRKQQQVQYTLNNYVCRIINIMQQENDKPRFATFTSLPIFSNSINSLAQNQGNDKINNLKALIVQILLHYKEILKLKERNDVRGLHFRDCVSKLLQKDCKGDHLIDKPEQKQRKPDQMSRKSKGGMIRQYYQEENQNNRIQVRTYINSKYMEKQQDQNQE